MKRTGDIWGVPPGGFESKPKKGPGLRIVVACTLVLLLGVGGGILVRSMQASTEVSTEDAVAQFRADKASAASASENAGKSAGKGPKSKSSAGSKGSSGRKTRARVTQGSGSGSAAVAAPAEQSRGGSAQDQRSASSSGGDRSAVPPFAPPKEGVYTWDVDGYERGPGVERQLPKRSHRVINHEGNDLWVEHHIYSEQKEQWFHLGGSKDGVFANSVRNRVEMGPVEVDRTVTFDPAMFVSRFPYEVGQTWQGSWEGKTSGSYVGRTLDHGTLVIGGEKVEVWVTEVKMEMRGEVEGDVTTRSWVAPEYSLVVKQYQESKVESGPGSYYSEWEGQVRSLQPQT